MTMVSRDDLHRAVEQLPDERLSAAAELLQALILHDDRVVAWRRELPSADEVEIAASLGREHNADEWVTDETVAAWIDADDEDEPHSQTSEPHAGA